MQIAFFEFPSYKNVMLLEVILHLYFTICNTNMVAMQTSRNVNCEHINAIIVVP